MLHKGLRQEEKIKMWRWNEWVRESESESERGRKRESERESKREREIEDETHVLHLLSPT